MGLRASLERQGDWLFRHRGVLPLLLLVILIPALWVAPTQPLSADAAGLRLYRGLSIAIAALGFLIRVLTVGCVPGGTSGRNTQGQVAATLNTTGAYSLVRHPLYLGNSLIYLGICSYPGVWWAVLLSALLLALYYERIILAEERFLRATFGPAFTSWAALTPTIVPRWRAWRAPALSFSLRTAARREYSGLFAMVLALAVLHQGLDAIAAHRYVFNRSWLIVLIVAGLIYLTLRTLKRRSRLLHVPGR